MHDENLKCSYAHIYYRETAQSIQIAGYDIDGAEMFGGNPLIKIDIPIKKSDLDNLINNYWDRINNAYKSYYANKSDNSLIKIYESIRISGAMLYDEFNKAKNFYEFVSLSQGADILVIMGDSISLQIPWDGIYYNTDDQNGYIGADCIISRYGKSRKKITKQENKYRNKAYIALDKTYCSQCVSNGMEFQHPGTITEFIKETTEYKNVVYIGENDPELGIRLNEDTFYGTEHIVGYGFQPDQIIYLLSCTTATKIMGDDTSMDDFKYMPIAEKISSKSGSTTLALGVKIELNMAVKLAEILISKIKMDNVNTIYQLLHAIRCVEITDIEVAGAIYILKHMMWVFGDPKNSINEGV